METAGVQIKCQSRVLEIDRYNMVGELPVPPRRPRFRQNLGKIVSSAREPVRSVFTGSFLARILYAVLAALTSAIWASSLGLFFFSTGWPALFHLAYAAASAGFAAVCVGTAFNLCSPEQLVRALKVRKPRQPGPQDLSD